MNKELKFDTFKYFLECYFNVSANYNELEDWDIVQGFVKKHGMRKLDAEKLRWLVKVIVEHLSSN